MTYVTTRQGHAVFRMTRPTGDRASLFCLSHPHSPIHPPVSNKCVPMLRHLRMLFGWLRTPFLGFRSCLPPWVGTYTILELGTKIHTHTYNIRTNQPTRNETWNLLDVLPTDNKNPHTTYRRRLPACLHGRSLCPPPGPLYHTVKLCLVQWVMICLGRRGWGWWTDRPRK